MRVRNEHTCLCIEHATYGDRPCFSFSLFFVLGFCEKIFLFLSSVLMMLISLFVLLCSTKLKEVEKPQIMNEEEEEEEGKVEEDEEKEEEYQEEEKRGETRPIAISRVLAKKY